MNYNQCYKSLKAYIHFSSGKNTYFYETNASCKVGVGITMIQ